MFCFDVLDVLFCGPEISSEDWTPCRPRGRYHIAILEKNMNVNFKIFGIQILNLNPLNP
jgi:hypothetical protein